VGASAACSAGSLPCLQTATNRRQNQPITAREHLAAPGLLEKALEGSFIDAGETLVPEKSLDLSGEIVGFLVR
jgi:hypothetical protein